MAPVWDPLADAADSSGPQGGDAAVVQKIVGKFCNSQKAPIVSHLSAKLQARTPWNATIDMTPDLDFMPQTCKSDDWRHQDVKLEISQGIGYVIMNRPNENNSLNDSIGSAMQDATTCMYQRPDLRIVVLTAEGRMFCAGGDPKGWQASAARARGEVVEGDGTVANRIDYVEAGPANIKRWTKFYNRGLTGKAFPEGGVGVGQLIAAMGWKMWANLPQFTICLANGSSMGGGVGWNCVCDYLIGVKKAFFVLSEVRIGVIPATISPYVIRKMGPSHAKRLFCTAENLKTAKAMEVGMANECVENMAEGHQRIKAICKLMTKCGPNASIVLKDLFLSITGQPMNEPVMALAHSRYSKSIAEKEGLEGLDVIKKGGVPSWESTVITPLY